MALVNTYVDETDSGSRRARQRALAALRHRRLPVGEERPQRGDERQWLIEDQMMVCLRYLDQRRVALQQFVHVFAGLGRDDRAELAAHQCNAAAHAREVIVQRAWRE